MDRTHKPLLALLTVVLLAGCASQAKTADALRETAKGKGMFASRDVFEVNKPYRQVSDSVKKKWLECLDSTTTGTVHRGGTMFATQTNVYKPKATVTPQRTELTLQHKITGGNKQLGSPPPDGFYIFVTDIYSTDKNTARMEMQKYTPGYAQVVKATRRWAEGTNMGCPDMSQ